MIREPVCFFADGEMFLFILTAIWGLNGVWLMAGVAAAVSGVLTIILAKTMKLEAQSGKNE